MTIMHVETTNGEVAAEAMRERLGRLGDGEPPIRPGMGWHRDLPDFRDYTPDHDAIAPLLAQTSAGHAGKGLGANPSTADLRPWFSPVENQGQLGSCTANAVVGLVEYFERRAQGKHMDGSRLFLYKATRDLLGYHGDTGASLRSTRDSSTCGLGATSTIS